MILLSNARVASASALLQGEFERCDLLICSEQIAGVFAPNCAPKSEQISRIIDCSHLAICAGFYNAHSHLDFAAARLDLGDFARWHSSIFSTKPQDAKHSERAINQAIAEQIASGVSHIGDISSTGAALKPLAASPLRALVYAELLAANDSVANERIAALEGKIEQIAALNLSPAISIHAPYSVCKSAAVKALEIADANQFHLSAHFSESSYEHAAICALNHTGAAQPNALAASLARFCPADLVGEQLLQMLPPERSQLVHCCYAAPETLEDFAEIAHCARSNALLGCARLQYSGSNLVIGTDGMSSNFSMNFLDELRAALWTACAANPAPNAAKPAPDAAQIARWLLAAAQKRPFAPAPQIAAGERADLVALVDLGASDDQLALRLLGDNANAAWTMIGGVIL